MKSVEFGRKNNTIVKHVEESGHKINLKKSFLEKDKTLYPEMILESCFIKENRKNV